MNTNSRCLLLCKQMMLVIDVLLMGTGDGLRYMTDPRIMRLGIRTFMILWVGTYTIIDLLPMGDWRWFTLRNRSVDHAAWHKDILI